MDLNQAKLRATFLVCRAAIARALAAGRAQRGGQTPAVRLTLDMERAELLTVTGRDPDGSPYRQASECLTLQPP